ncbi:hypothetical protein M9458_037958 [Cirrhinus mrigala]|uniref:Spermatogenesis-associated protein 46 n=1 Tax=Cirrhinus mrigala TaxID=683832 RepID=A0ABD0NW57_CIRMR
MERLDVKPNCSEILPRLRFCTGINHLFRDLQSLGLNACFIQTVTETKVVCGIKRYKCSGCLCYYDELEQLMTHIEQGWREGYSCRAFYRKLKDMKDCKELLYEEEEAAASESNPQLGAFSTRKRSSRDEKLDMVLRWLQECMSSSWQ